MGKRPSIKPLDRRDKLTPEEKEASRLTRFIRRLTGERAPQPSRHRVTNKYGAQRRMTGRVPSQVRKRNRARNKIARASRKRNTP